MLSFEQIKTLSSILADLGQVSIASVVLPFVIPNFSKEAIMPIVVGTFLALFFWFLSILLVKHTTT